MARGEFVRSAAQLLVPALQRHGQRAGADFFRNTPRDFTDRFDGDPDYFSGKGKAYPGRVWDTNFIADARNFALEDWKERGAAGKNVMLELANGSMAAHISE